LAFWLDARSVMQAIAFDLDVDISCTQGIIFNERPTWFNIITHQRSEDLVRSNRVLDLHFEQTTNRRIHGVSAEARSGDGYERKTGRRVRAARLYGRE
jgi:hypothetical protein